MMYSLRFTSVLFSVFFFAFPAARADSGGIERAFVEQANYNDAKLVEGLEGGPRFFASKNHMLSVRPFTIPARPEDERILPISSDWIAAMAVAPRQVLVSTASFNDKRIRLYRIDPSTWKSEPLAVIGGRKGFKIDPSLERVGNRYFMTYTTIKGTVNNDDPTKPNGHYRINFLESTDMSAWKQVGVVAERQKNLEDTRIHYSPATKRLYALFEDEEYDKGPSTIYLVESADWGRTWTKQRPIVSGADDEPAGLVELNGSLMVFFSSDKNHPGKSYGGADAYFSSARAPFEIWDAPRAIALDPRILFIDAERDARGAFEFAAIQDYQADHKLIWYRVPEQILLSAP
jgi:hypothetical protein